jgi:hypothetical protein
MAKIIEALCLALLVAQPAFADDLIQQANNQESLVIGVAPLHVTEQSLAPQGSVYVNYESGTRYLVGIDEARTRTIFGVPDLYTDLEVLLGVATLGYSGSALNSAGGLTGTIGQPVSYAQESVRLRMGRSWGLPAEKNLALTPFVGISQQAWGRDTPSGGPADLYDQLGIELGVLLQVSLPYHLVFGADAAQGRTLGAVLFNHSYGNLDHATSSAFALKLDHRTFADWHQRLEIRQTFLRYGQTANAPGYFEPRRSSDLAIMLEFGTETSLF